MSHVALEAGGIGRGASIRSVLDLKTRSIRNLTHEALSDLALAALACHHSREAHRIDLAVVDLLAHIRDQVVTPWEDHSLPEVDVEHLVGVRMISGLLDHPDNRILHRHSLHYQAGKRRCRNRNHNPGQNTRLAAGLRAERDEGRSFARVEASALGAEDKP